MISETRLPPSACPVCGTVNDAASSITGRGGPSEGDLSVCLTCGSILRYGPGLSLLETSEAEMREVYDRNPGLEDLMRQIQQAWEVVDRERRRQ